MFSKIPQGFCKVVDHESVVIGKEVHPHFGDFPARQIVVQSIDEGHIFANDIGHRSE